MKRPRPFLKDGLHSGKIVICSSSTVNADLELGNQPQRSTTTFSEPQVTLSGIYRQNQLSRFLPQNLPLRPLIPFKNLQTRGAWGPAREENIRVQIEALYQCVTKSFPEMSLY